MMKCTLVVFLVVVGNLALAQGWIDTTFSTSTELDVEYGIAKTFAGFTDTLKLDVSYPADDVPPDCGRPLMVVIHGGGWFSGDKNEGYPRRLRQDFAKRGYVTASVNYRLGQFHTDRDVNCNVPGWNCFNMTDSSEFYRANHRAVQDVNGAIRYLVNNADRYRIDPDKLFVVGESAGGFVAMGVGFIDDESEVLSGLVGEYPNAPRPNARYENACIRNFGLANSIGDMDLARPALGSYEGSLNMPPATEYRIRAVGNIYGGAFSNIFKTHKPTAPALYLYHQPCDLVVPIGRTRLLTGFVNCLSQFPTFCGNIFNRPFIYGSRGIRGLIDTMAANAVPTTEYFYDQSNNNFNCFQQVDPAFGCHAIDAYWLRTTNMATYFAGFIDTCLVNSAEGSLSSGNLVDRAFPNPAQEMFYLKFDGQLSKVDVEIVDVLGRSVRKNNYRNIREARLDLSGFPDGVYRVLISTSRYRQVLTVVKN